jgi:RHS repeat-associated protein
MATTSSIYNALGQLQSTTTGTRGWAFAYDASGNLHTTTDPTTATTTYDVYDLDGRVEHVILPVTSSTSSQSYDLNGNLASITVPPATPPLSSKHAFTYTPLNLLGAYDPPQVSSADGGVETPLATLNTSYAYDPNHNPISTQVPEGTGYDTVVQLFDANSRLSSTYDPISLVTSAYSYLASDQVGSIVTSDGVTLTNTFDGFLKSKTAWSSSLFNNSVGWTYDPLLRPLTLAIPSGTTVATFEYADPSGLYTGATSPTASPFSVTRDLTTGLPTGAALGATAEVWTYDAYGAPATYTVTSGSTTLYLMSITSRDQNGRIQDMTENNNGTAHTWSGVTYDPMGRLTSVTLDGTTRTYGYDANSNLTKRNSTVVGTYDAQDRLLTMNTGTATQSATYTNNGDLASTSIGLLSYEYDVSRNLRKVSTRSTIQYAIDGTNRRIGKSWTASSTTIEKGFMYDEQGRVVAELTGTSGALALRSVFVYGLKQNVPDYMIQGSKTYLIVSDWRGSVRQVLDPSTNPATVKETIDYDEWGNVLTLNDPSCTTGFCLNFQPFGFAGGIYEPLSGFVRFGARDYDPQFYRWVQKDPIRFDGGQLNLYVYAGDDPINGSDPLGTGDSVACAIAFAQTLIGGWACAESAGLLTPACAAFGAGLAAFTYVCWPTPPPTTPTTTPTQPTTACP